MDKTKYQSKNQIVYETIRDAIISGEFEPGSRLVIDNLALKYNISHSPIRECMRLLEADGLVTIRPYAGVTVTELHPELIMEVFALLESFEIISSCRASLRATPAQFKILTQMIEEMGQYIALPNEWSAKNFELHMTICEIADMTIMKNMMYRTLMHWDRLRRYYLETVSSHRIAQAQLEHHDLLNALKSSEEQQIMRVIQQHNKAALDDYLNHIRETQKIDLHVSHLYGSDNKSD